MEKICKLVIGSVTIENPEMCSDLTALMKSVKSLDFDAIHTKVETTVVPTPVAPPVFTEFNVKDAEDRAKALVVSANADVKVGSKTKTTSKGHSVKKKHFFKNVRMHTVHGIQTYDLNSREYTVVVKKILEIWYSLDANRFQEIFQSNRMSPKFRKFFYNGFIDASGVRHPVSDRSHDENGRYNNSVDIGNLMINVNWGGRFGLWENYLKQLSKIKDRLPTAVTKKMAFEKS